MFRSPIASEGHGADLQSRSALCMFRGAPRVAAGLSLAAVIAWSATGLGDDKQACVEAYREAQKARRDEDLLRAREHLLVCSGAQCPSIVQNDCIPWLAEVQKAVPSVILSARSADGRDLVNVQVTMDDKLLVSSLDGKSIDLNPGVHEFRFETPGLPAVSQKVLIQKTEKDRVIRVTLGTRTAADSPAAPQVRTETTRPVPVWAWVAAGAGLAGWGGLAYFGLRFDKQYDDLSACDPNCPSSQIDEASTSRTLAFVSMGVGLVGTGVATTLYLMRPEVPVTTAARNRPMGVSVIPTPGGGVALVGGRF